MVTIRPNVINKVLKVAHIFMVFLTMSRPIAAHAEQPLPSNYLGCRPWAVLFYLGKMTNQTLGRVLTFDFQLDRDTLYSFEISKQLSPIHPISCFFSPLATSVDLRGNVTLLNDSLGEIVEFNPYLTLNWSNFPWCHYLRTVISIGEGLSFVSQVPLAEIKNSDAAKKWLNFLLLEVAISLPQQPQWEIIARIHHRSGAFGLYHANNSGSTAIGIALRYRF